MTHGVISLSSRFTSLTWGPGMLKISRSEGSGSTCTLKLEGKLLAPWIDELASACRWFPTSTERVRLDLASLTFVDAEGVRFLKSLIREGIEVIACSGFVAEMLQCEGP